MKADPGAYRLTGQPVQLKVERGPTSWAYFYVFLGFALSIEASVIAFIDPLKWPWNLVAFVLISGLTIYLVLFNARFQNKLLVWKTSYEEKAR